MIGHTVWLIPWRIREGCSHAGVCNLMHTGWKVEKVCTEDVCNVCATCVSGRILSHVYPSYWLLLLLVNLTHAMYISVTASLTNLCHEKPYRGASNEMLLKALEFSDWSSYVLHHLIMIQTERLSPCSRLLFAIDSQCASLSTKNSILPTGASSTIRPLYIACRKKCSSCPGTRIFCYL